MAVPPPPVEAAVHSELVRGLARDLSLKQCEAGYVRLPVVPKRLYSGPKRGLFYINQKGKRVYLNRPQKHRMAQNKLPGLTNAPGVVPVFAPGQNPEAVFARIDQQIRAAGAVG